MLLALQQHQSTQAINSECAAIRQEIGALKAQVDGLKTGLGDTSKDVSGIRRTHHIALGVFLAISVLIGVLWYFVGSKVSTLLVMADERQISDLHEERHPSPSPSET